MTKRVGLLLTVMVVAALLSGCCPLTAVGRISPRVVTGSGRLETRQFDFADFTAVEVSHAIQVELIQGESFVVEITADDNMFGEIEITKSARTLRIALQRNVSYRNNTVRAKITMPDLREVELSGASQGTLAGFSSTDDLRLVLSGASTLRGDISAGDIRCNVSGASTLVLRGAGRNGTLNVSGASTADLQQFSLRDLDAEVSGASRAEVEVSGTLNATLSGASTLTYGGNPRLGRTNVTGASSLRER